MNRGFSTVTLRVSIVVSPLMKLRFVVSEGE